MNRRELNEEKYSCFSVAAAAAKTFPTFSNAS